MVAVLNPKQWLPASFWFFLP